MSMCPKCGTGFNSNEIVTKPTLEPGERQCNCGAITLDSNGNCTKCGKQPVPARGEGAERVGAPQVEEAALRVARRIIKACEFGGTWPSETVMAHCIALEFLALTPAQPQVESCVACSGDHPTYAHRQAVEGSGKTSLEGQPFDDDLRGTLRKEFEDREYREAYLESFRDSLIAMHLAAIRKDRGWTQEKLAQETGTKQSAIARMEDVNYGKWTVGTLRKIANAYGLDLCIRFQSIDRALHEITTLAPLDGLALSSHPASPNADETERGG